MKLLKVYCADGTVKKIQVRNRAGVRYVLDTWEGPTIKAVSILNQVPRNGGNTDE